MYFLLIYLIPGLKILEQVKTLDSCGTSTESSTYLYPHSLTLMTPNQHNQLIFFNTKGVGMMAKIVWDDT